MPKNTSGGKKHKKGKTAIGNDENRSLLEASPGQCYALVTKLCGNSMINCRVYHRTVTRDSRGNESVSFSTEEKIGVIRNSLKKKKILVEDFSKKVGLSKTTVLKNAREISRIFETPEVLSY